jgi:type I restriction enzyme R subunit
VVTDRRILDDQIQKTIKQFMQVGSTVGAVTGDVDFQDRATAPVHCRSGKKIIISTIQTFPHA